MANTFDTVVQQVLAQEIPLARPALPSALLYGTPIKLNGPVTAGKTALPIITSVQATQLNPTTYENSTDSISSEEPTLVHYSAQFGFNAPDQARGLDLRMLLASHLTTLEDTLQVVINGAITVGNFGAAAVTVAAGSFVVGSLETLLAAVPARTCVCLAPSYYVKVKNNWMPSGEEGKLHELSTLPGGNVVGFSARPEALALIYGFPSVGPSSEVTTSTIRLPLGLDVQFSRWYSRGGRAWRASLDICFVPQVGQAAALKLITSA